MRLSLTTRSLLVAATSAWLSVPAPGQCQNPWEVTGAPPPALVVGTSVRATVMWGTKLVVAGSFTQVGSVAVSNIAIWDAATGTWSALGAGTNGSVQALTVWNGDLVAGGSFTTAGVSPANRIARWDGTAWSALGAGTNAPVQALTVWNGNLVAGGTFTTAGPSPASRIASWNGTTWSALNSGLNSSVAALTTMANGDLVAGGTFTSAGGGPANRIARWDGTTWSAFGSGCNESVDALTVMANGDLVAGGTFTGAGGSQANKIARWDGIAWSPLGAYTLTSATTSVLDLATMANGDVVAGGEFTFLGGAYDVNNIARWDGTAWRALATGVNARVHALAIVPADGSIVVGGEFSSADGLPAVRLARWSGAVWTGGAFGSGPTFGMNGDVKAIVRMPNGDVVAGGSFTTSNGVVTNRIARWNGREWLALGSGMNNEVSALAVTQNGDVIAGGQFTNAGGAAVNYIARWDGGTWSPLGLGMGSYVRALTTLPNGDLVAGGVFTTAGGAPANYVARWNGTSWAALGAGTNYWVTALTALANGDLVAGGHFTAAGGAPANRVARWNGTAWSALGSGCNNPVYALTTLPNGDVVAGGDFTTAGGTSALCVARWDGTYWFPLGAGCSIIVNALVTLANGDVVAGGGFNFAGGSAVKKIARWNGSAWSPLGTGTNLAIYCLAALPGNHIVAGGNFSTAGDQAIQRVAHWSGTAWSPLGSYGNGFDGTVRCFANMPDGTLVAGGDFASAAGRPVRDIAVWDGVVWSGLPPGGPSSFSGVHSLLALPDGALIVGGDGGISRWHGTAWSSLTPIASFPRPYGPVTQLALHPNGDIFASGRWLSFPFATPYYEYPCASWSGTTWIGQLGVSGGPPSPPFTPCEALFVSRIGDLYLGLRSQGTSTFSHFAYRWTGTGFAPLTAGWSSTWTGVSAFTERPDGSLLASISTGVSEGAAIWNGSTWSASATSSGRIEDLLSLPNGDIVAAGDFTTIGGVAQVGANRIARWDGTTWFPIGAGVDAPVHALAFTPDSALAVGGEFTHADAQDSLRFARLTTSCPATSTSYGAGCVGAGGLNVLTSNLPWIGSTFSKTATGMPPVGLVLDALGFSTLAVPVHAVFSYGVPGCFLYTPWDYLRVRLPVAGVVTSQITLPMTATLVGLQFYSQMVPLEANGVSFTAATSTNALASTIGVF